MQFWRGNRHTAGDDQTHQATHQRDNQPLGQEHAKQVHRCRRARQLRRTVIRHQEPADPGCDDRPQPSEQDGGRKELDISNEVQARSAYDHQQGCNDQAGHDPRSNPQARPVDALQSSTAGALPPPFAQVAVAVHLRPIDRKVLVECQVILGVIGHETPLLISASVEYRARTVKMWDSTPVTVRP